MAAMDQGKLNNMCKQINDEASTYVSNVNSQVTSMVDTFNQNWVSNSAQTLANEISECLSSLADSITRTFSDKNEAIRMSVQNFNQTEDESISYSGFSFGKPNVSLQLNSTLPNGKKGVADGADLDTINTPMKMLIDKVSTSLDQIRTTVSSADAFDNAEQQALTNSINNIKNTFVENMSELKNSLQTRMSSEISTRDSLDKTNIENLSA